MDASESDVYLSLKMIEVINHPNVSDSHRDDLTGAAIMLLLKRQKINKLVALQAKAQHLYDRWVAQNIKDPDFTWTMLLDPSPSKEFLDNKGNVEKLNFTFILIPEWWKDDNYYEHFPFVKNALKPVIQPFTDARFLEILHQFHLKRFISQILSGIPQPINFASPQVLSMMAAAKEKAMEKIELAKNAQEFTLKPIIVDTPDHQRDVRVTVNSSHDPELTRGRDIITVKPGDSDKLMHEIDVHLSSFCGHLPPDKKKEFIDMARIFFDPPASGFQWDLALQKQHLLPYNYAKPDSVFIKRPLIDKLKIPLALKGDHRLAIKLHDGTREQIVFLLKKSIAFPVKNISLQLARRSFTKWLEIERTRQMGQRERERAQLVAATMTVPQKSKSAYELAKERRSKGKKSPTFLEVDDSKEAQQAARRAAAQLLEKDAQEKTDEYMNMKKKKPKKKKKKKKKSKSQSPTESGDPPEIASMKDVELDITDNLKISADQEKKEMYDLKKSIFKDFKHNNNLKIWNFLLVHLQKLMKENLLDSFVIISGGMATFLHTKGTYPTEDLDVKVYPKVESLSSWNYEEVAQQIFKMVQTFLQENQTELLKDLKNYLNMNNVIQISALLVRGDTIKISFQTEELIEASPEKPVTVRGTFYASNTTIKNWVAYCDIGIWKPWNKDQRIESEQKFLEEALARNKRNINEIPSILQRFKPKNVHDVVIQKLKNDGKEWYSFGGLHTPPNSFTYNDVTTIFPIVNPDYLLYEKTELVRDIDEKTYYYNNHKLVWDQKVDRWKTQIRLLKLNNALKKGGKRKTRRRRKKRKSHRRKKTRRTRRKSRRR